MESCIIKDVSKNMFHVHFHAKLLSLNNSEKILAQYLCCANTTNKYA